MIVNKGNCLKVQIYHNPRCSKSRQTLELLNLHGIRPTVVEYLNEVPSKDELKNILKLLGMKPRELMRVNEPEYKALGLDNKELSENDLIEAMLKTPKLIERPIVVVDASKAVIGRPPEKVLDIIK